LAILLIPAPGIPSALTECGRRGLKAAIIGSGGFRETGPQGAALEEECLRLARSFGMRLIGPNCIGLIDTHLPIDTTFLPPPGPLPGDVAFISHSGAICAAVIDWARGHSFGLSLLVSLGNQVDVNETDVLQPVAEDSFTKVLTLYIEGIRDGRRFVSEAGRITRQKPVIALKVGRFAGGQRAVASHTGALAGKESAYNAAFRRAGVIRAETSEEMFDWARALAWCPPPKGRDIAILTNAGGPGVTAADALEMNGMRLAELSQATRQQLADELPPAASLVNPVDMLASASPEQYASCLAVLLEDPNVYGVMVILPPPPMFTAGAVARAIIPVIHHAEKPVVVALMGERLIQEAVEHLRAAHVPEYRFPERAASALAALTWRAEYLARPQQPPQPPPGLERERARRLFQANLGSLTQGNWLPAELLEALLACYGIQAPQSYLAVSPEQAVGQARQLGFPVALKIASPDIPHKSDVRGVLLNLWDESAVRSGFSQVVENAGQAAPGAQIDGVKVQKMFQAGQDLILGALQDPQFGALVMFGAGGVEAEQLKDITFALAPMTGEEVEYMIANTWAGRRLSGYRDLPAADRTAVSQALLRFSFFAADFPELVEVEVNPLRAMPEGQGAFALDLRARLGSKINGSFPAPPIAPA
ncbi:MAG: acetate--CoA ligase family protein, partial [Anaerolineales bacterium]|nr:acetate--CoA ligase family protein [Anaerolineales bacterium]